MSKEGRPVNPFLASIQDADGKVPKPTAVPESSVAAQTSAPASASAAAVPPPAATGAGGARSALMGSIAGGGALLKRREGAASGPAASAAAAPPAIRSAASVVQPALNPKFLEGIGKEYLEGRISGLEGENTADKLSNLVLLNQELLRRLEKRDGGFEDSALSAKDRLAQIMKCKDSIGRISNFKFKTYYLS